MDARQREQLRRHREDIVHELVESGRVPDVIYELQVAEIISSHNSLLESETTKSQRVRALLGRLEASEAPDCFQQFMEVLLRLDMVKLVQKLDLSTYEQHRGSISGESVEMEGLHRLPHLLSPSLDRPMPLLPRSPLASPAPGSDRENNNPRQPLHIRVTPYNFKGGMHLPDDDVYPNTSKPRGLVFLANYKDFRDSEHPTRHGSEIDTKNLVMLFSQMGYQVTTPHLNMTKGETLAALREFRGKDKLGQVDSCVVVIMSHGRDHRSFYTSDNLYLPVNEVVDNFNNRACPLLQGKPKIFIFQYCRGVGQDVGVLPAAPHNVSNTRGLSVETDSSRFGEVIDRDPTFSDMYIVYSTIEGYASFRHPESGSWLVEALCTVFMEHSCLYELGHLMKMVSKKVSSNYTDDGNKQMCELVQRGFDKHFYFNPEPLEGM